MGRFSVAGLVRALFVAVVWSAFFVAVFCPAPSPQRRWRLCASVCLRGCPLCFRCALFRRCLSRWRGFVALSVSLPPPQVGQARVSSTKRRGRAFRQHARQMKPFVGSRFAPTLSVAKMLVCHLVTTALPLQSNRLLGAYSISFSDYPISFVLAFIPRFSHYRLLSFIIVYYLLLSLIIV